MSLLFGIIKKAPEVKKKNVGKVNIHNSIDIIIWIIPLVFSLPHVWWSYNICTPYMLSIYKWIISYYIKLLVIK